MKSDRPLTVSVITITMDDPQGLERTTASLLAQRGDFEVEHIVVDGASSPETVEILTRLESGSRLIAEPDAGRYDAMNKGIRAARGDVLWFMHSADVFSTPYSIAMALDTLTDDARQEWGFGFARLLDEAGNTTFISMQAFPFSLTALSMGGVVPHQAAYFGADLVARLGEYVLDLPIAADQHFMMRAAKLVEPRRAYQVLCDFAPGGLSANLTLSEFHRELRHARLKADLPLTRGLSFHTVTIGYLVVRDAFLFRITALLRRVRRER